MIWFAFSRRAVSVVVVVLALLTVPAVAEAQFSSSRTSALPVGSARMGTPTAVTGSYACLNNRGVQGFKVTVNGFSDAEPAGATYEYTLTRGATLVKTVTTGSHSVTLQSGMPAVDGTATTWTISIRSKLGGWTGTAYTHAITCAYLGTGTGSL